MKLRICLLSLLMICVAALGCAASTADAIIVAPDTSKITAPYAGTLQPFDLSSGDSVEAGELLFAFETNPVYATQGGKVVSIFADVGDDAGGAISRYGALAVIEPEIALYIDANTDQAYDDNENKYVHVGEEIYLKCGNTKGTGRITAVNQKQYTVEILTGDFKLKDTVRCYRESGYTNDSEIGQGKIYRYPYTLVSTTGRVLAVHIHVGDVVKSGDLLFETVDALAAPDAGSEILSPVTGVISKLTTTSGSQVYRGQLLCEITDLSHLELSCEMDEIDLPNIHVGDTLSYTLDAYPDRTLSGTVTHIYPLGTKKLNASYFDVRVTITSDLALYPGMNATVTIPGSN